MQVLIDVGLVFLIVFAIVICAVPISIAARKIIEKREFKKFAHFEPWSKKDGKR